MIPFLEELRRRRVFRVALVYGVVGWALVQVADTTFPHLGLPPWAVTFVITFVLLGFPLALLLAWAFDLTPDGVVPTAPAQSALEASGTGAVSAPRRSWVPMGGIVLVAGALGIGLPLSVRAPGNADTGAHHRTASIAVLPFANLSGDAGADAFVSGLHHELLTQLARVSALDYVVPRTSVMTYSDTRKRIPEIAMELGASLVLEAAVQQVGDLVRIHLLLVDGTTEQWLWSETYERTLTVASLFDIQADIARRIARELEAELTPEEDRWIRTLPTENLEAYDLYVRALAHGERWSEPEELLTAVHLLDRAVELDPQFVEAWAWISVRRRFLAWAYHRVDEAPRAEAALDRALALDPDAPLTVYALGVRHYRHRNFEDALRLFDRAERIQPNLTHGVRAMVLRRLGRWDEAVALLERQIEADPRSYEQHTALADFHLRLRHFDEALRALDRAVAVAPARGLAHRLRVDIALAMGDTTGARRMLEDLPSNVDPATRQRIEATVAYHARDFRHALERWPRENSADYNRLAAIALRLGAPARARALADSARSEAEAMLRYAQAVGGPLSVNAQVRAHTWLAHALAVHGDHREARRHARAALDLVPVDLDQSTGVETLEAMPEIFLLLGDLDGAIGWLEQLLALPSLVSPGNLRVDPMYDALRDHPAFQRLLEESRT